MTYRDQPMRLSPPSLANPDLLLSVTVRQPEARVVFILISTHAVTTHIGTDIDSLTYLLVTCLTAFHVMEK